MKNIKSSESKSDYWHHHIQSWQQADTSQIVYCRAHDLNYHRFLYWRRKLTASESDPKPTELRSGFVPVKAVMPEAPANLTATLPNGVILQGIAPGNLSVVKQLLGLQS